MAMEYSASNSRLRNRRRAGNKAVWPGKKSKIINIGPTSIPEPRVCTLYDCTCLAYNLI